MATLDDVRRIALKLPETEESPERFGISVPFKGKRRGFVWSWAERIHPKKARVPNDGVMAIIVQNLTVKEMLLASDPGKFFTEDHYNGFPAVLVRLEAIDPEELEDILIEAWRCKAPPDLVARYNAD